MSSRETDVSFLCISCDRKAPLLHRVLKHWLCAETQDGARELQLNATTTTRICTDRSMKVRGELCSEAFAEFSQIFSDFIYFEFYSF